MAIALVAAQVVHARKVRLVFSESVHASAYTTLSYYAALSINALGASPAIVAAFATIASPNVVELQLSLDLAPGGTYEFTAVGVPNVGSTSTTPGGSTVALAFGEQPVHAIAPKAAISFADEWLYNLDIVYSDVDFVEDAAGDLAEAAGPPLVRRDLENRALSDGLPWEPSYGLHSRSYIDGTPGALLTLRGAAISQMLEDDRVVSCDATLGEETDTGEGYLEIAPKLLGDPLLSEITPIRVATNT